MYPLCRHIGGAAFRSLLAIISVAVIRESNAKPGAWWHILHLARHLLLKCPELAHGDRLARARGHRFGSRKERWVALVAAVVCDLLLPIGPARIGIILCEVTGESPPQQTGIG